MSKPWLDFDAQVNKQREYGLIVGSPEEFRAFLKDNNYYRFTGYGRLFQQYSPSVGWRYLPDTNDGQIRAIYEQDEALRLLLWEGLSAIERSLRTQIVYYLARNLPTEGYLDETRYTVSRRPGQISNSAIVTKFRKDIHGSKEKFVQHYVSRNEPVPFWVACEVLTFGQFSVLIGRWKDQRELSTVAQRIGFKDSKNLRQGIYSLSFLRNCVTHHHRIWHYEFSNNPPKLSNPQIFHSPYGSRSPAAQIELAMHFARPLLGYVYLEKVRALVLADGFVDGLINPSL